MLFKAWYLKIFTSTFLKHKNLCFVSVDIFSKFEFTAFVISFNTISTSFSVKISNDLVTLSI